MLAGREHANTGHITSLLLHYQSITTLKTNLQTNPVTSVLFDFIKTPNADSF